MKSFNEWMEQRESYEPLITTNSVLFPVIHNQNVISTPLALQKMQELIKKRVTIWHEGQEAELVVEEFLKTPHDGGNNTVNIPELANLQKRSWETSSPKKISQQRFQQGSLLTSIFGGNDATKKTKEILGHPFVKHALQTGKKLTILDALNLASNNPESRDTDSGLEAKVGNTWMSQPEGWYVYSSSPVSKEDIKGLLDLVKESTQWARELKKLAVAEASETNLISFLKIGRHQGFNKPTFTGKATTSLSILQKDVNYERDLELTRLVQSQEGGIFFAGADHVPNVMRLMQQQQ